MIFKVAYLLVPAIFANITPVLVKKHFKKLDYPIDFGIKIFGKRIFGKNKTFRGFIFGMLISLIFALIQKLLHNYDFFKSLSLINYSSVNIILFGLLCGF